jgi:leucyl aminopeptidase
MLDMKGDMSGAAVVLGAISALSSLGVQAEVHAIIAATENMISGSAYKLGDVITGMNGKSVEIVNTDAEGRLTLADALAYAEKLKPDELLDVATLTGACMVALGPHMAGIMGNDRALVERLIATARRVGEDVWGLPLPTKLRQQLKTPMADMKNCGERWGGALTAGLFLKEFVTMPWVHMDIAGPALADKADGHISKGGTGFGVSTLIEYVSSRDGSQ